VSGGRPSHAKIPCFMEVNSKQTDPLDHSLFYIYSMNHQWPMTSHRDQKILSGQKAKRAFPWGMVNGFVPEISRKPLQSQAMAPGLVRFDRGNSVYCLATTASYILSYLLRSKQTRPSWHLLTSTCICLAENHTTSS
jgi:hypothetical protein